jgi:hypothetical protein
VTKLYRHVDQLVAAGFLRVVDERPRRGAIERRFIAAGHRFLVAPGAAGESQKGALARAALENLLREAGDLNDPAGPVHLMRSRVRMTPDALRRFEAGLRDLLETYVSDDGVETNLLIIAAPHAEA